MKFMLVFTFFLSICYGAIWISIGLLLLNHLETVLSMVLRKPIPDNLINPQSLQNAKRVIKVIGVLLILIGIATIILGLNSMVTGFNMTNHPNFNFNF